MGQSKVKKTFRERITPLLDCFLSHFTFICLKVIKARFNSVKPDERLKALKNKYEGKRCFIVGLGPSLTVEDLNLLKEKGEYTFSMNRCYQLFDKTSWRPDAYLISDAKACTPETMEVVNEMLADNILVLYSKLEIGNFPKDAIYFKTDFTDFILRNSKNAKYRVKSHRCRMSPDAYEYIYAGSSCVHSIIQIAYYMGFKDVYLIGTDCGTANNKSYSDALKQNNNDAYIRGEGNLMIADYASMKDDVEKKTLDFHVYNCSRGGMLEVFPHKQIEEVINSPIFGTNVERKI